MMLLLKKLFNTMHKSLILKGLFYCILSFGLAPQLYGQAGKIDPSFNPIVIDNIKIGEEYDATDPFLLLLLISSWNLNDSIYILQDDEFILYQPMGRFYDSLFYSFSRYDMDGNIDPNYSPDTTLFNIPYFPSDSMMAIVERENLSEYSTSSLLDYLVLADGKTLQLFVLQDFFFDEEHNLIDFKENYKIFRTNVDGSIDTTFNSSLDEDNISFLLGNINFSGYTFYPIQLIGIQPNGKVLVSYYTKYDNGGVDSLIVIRLNHDGSIDPSYNFYYDYGKVYFTKFQEVEMRKDGSLVVKGNEGSFQFENYYNIDGAYTGNSYFSFTGSEQPSIPDYPWGFLYANIRNIPFQDGSQLYYCFNPDKFIFSYWPEKKYRYGAFQKADGRFQDFGLDSSINAALVNYGGSGFLQPNGKILLVINKNLIRLNANGSIDQSFSLDESIVGRIDAIYGMQSSGGIIVSYTDTDSTKKVVRLLNHCIDAVAHSETQTTCTPTYTWKNDITYTQSGTYVYEYLRGDTCFADTLHLHFFQTPTITTTAATCDSIGTATISNYNAHYTYTVSPNTASIDGNGRITGVAGIYTVKATVDTCESISAPFTLDDQLAAPTTTLVQPTCTVATGSVTVTNPLGGADYTLTGINPVVAGQTNTSGIFTGLASGEYSLIITTANCQSPTTSVTIDAQPQTPVAPTATLIHPTCTIATGSITVTNPLSGATYKLTGPSVKTNTTGVFTGVVSGNYSLTVTKNGCTSPATTVTIDAQPQTSVVPIVEVNAATCAADGYGQIINYDNSLTYIISPTSGQIDGNGKITGVAGTVYTVTVTAANTCESEPFILDEQLEPLTLSANGINPSMCGGTDGSITLSLTGVYNGVYTVSYNNTSVDVTVIGGFTEITGLGAGTYSNIAVNNWQCNSTDIVSVNLTDPLAPSAPTATLIHPTCTLETGIVEVTNPLGGLEYTLTGINPVVAGQTKNDGVFVNLASGEYSLTVTENGCTSPATAVTIDVQPQTPEVPMVSVFAATCTADEYGQITNYDNSLTYTISPTSGQIDGNGKITGVTRTTYTVTGIAANTCESESLPFTLDDRLDSPTLSASGTNPTTCGGTDGSITVSLTGVYDINYTVSFNNTSVDVPVNGGIGEIEITGLGAGTYSNITVSNGVCNSTDIVSVNLTDPLPPSAPTATLIHPTCTLETGIVTVDNPITGATYSLAGLSVETSTTGVFTGVTSGNYSLTVTENGCTSLAASVTIDAQPQTPAVPVVNVTATCADAGYGQITNYDNSLTYTISPTSGQIDGNGKITGVAGTSYTVKATAGNTCESESAPFTLDGQLVSPTLSASGTNPTTCGGTDGKITLSLTDVADGIYTVSYNNTSASVTVAGGSAEITGLGAGAYAGITINNGQCVSNAGSASLSDPNSPSAPTASLVQPTCTVATGSVTVDNPVAGATYSLAGLSVETNTTGIFTGVASGNYSLTVTENGCTSPAASVTIDAQPQTPAVPAVDVIAATCTADEYGQITNYDNSLTYTISPASGNIDGNGGITGVAGTSYTVKATAGNTCESESLPFTFDGQLVSPTLSASGTNPSVCGGTDGKITLFTDLYDAIYLVSFNNTSASVTVAGGSAEITGLGAGLYTGITINNGQCDSKDVVSVNLSDPNVPSAPVASLVQPTCTVATGSVIVTNPLGGADYTLTGINPVVAGQTNNSGIFTGLASGEYSLTVTTANCQSPAASVTIDAQPQILAVPVVNVTATCADAGYGQITNFDNSLSYTISPTSGQIDGNGKITGVAGTSYTVKATAGNTCESESLPFTFDGQLVSPTSPTITIVENDCIADTDGSISATGCGVGFTTEWSEDGNVWSTTVPTYTTTAKAVYARCVDNNSGCVSVVSKAVTNPCDPSTTCKIAVVATATPSIACEGAEVSLISTVTDATGNIGYVWTGPNGFTSTDVNATIQSALVSSTGVYTLEVTDENSCTATTTVSVIINEQPQASVSNNGPKCEGETVILNTNNILGASYAWSGPNNYSSSLQMPNVTEAGTYSVTVSVEGCQASVATTQVIINETPVANAGSDITTQAGVPVQLNGSGGLIYDWSPTDNISIPNISNPTFISNVNGVYPMVLTVMNEFECSDKDTLILTVEAGVINEDNLIVSNVITPNGDGFNDVWVIEIVKDDVVIPLNSIDMTYEISVFSRSGNKVMSSTHYMNDWGGTYNGNNLPDGVYWYIIIFEDGSSYKDSIMIKR